MRRWCDNERAFWAEQQNRPLESATGSVKLSAKEIMHAPISTIQASRKTNGLAQQRISVPPPHPGPGIQDPAVFIHELVPL